MAATVKINFSVGDLGVVDRSVRSVVQSAQRAAASEARKGAKVAADAQKDAARQASRADAERVKQANRLELQAAKQTSQERLRLIRETNATQRAELKRNAAAELATTRRSIEVERTASRERMQMRRREFQLADREQKKIDRATKGKVGGGGDGAVREGAGRGFRRATGTMMAAGGVAMGVMGGIPIVDAVKQAIDLEKINAQLAADVRDPGGKALDTKELEKRQRDIAKKTGFSAVDVAEAMSTAAGEGGGAKGLQAFMGILDEVGEVALASGTDMRDLAKVSATMTNNMVTDAKEQASVMRALLASAKAGNINLREGGERIMAVAGAHQASGFQGTGEQRVLQAGGLLQIARLGGATSAEDAATAGRNFYNDLAKKEDDLRKKHKVTTMRGGKRVDAIDQVAELFENTGGDVRKIDAIFGQQAQSIVGAFGAAYRGENKNLRDGSGRVLTGRAAIKELERQSSAAKMTQEDVRADAAIVLNTNANKLARTFEAFNEKVATDLIPVLTKYLPEFGKGLEYAAKAVKIFAENPGWALAGFVALNVTLGAAEAAMGRWIASLVTGAAANNAASGAGGAAAAGIGSRLGPAAGAALFVGSAVASGLAGMGDADKADARTAMDIGTAKSLTEKLKSGDGDAKDMAAGQKLLARLESSTGASGFLERAKAGVAGGYEGLANRMNGNGDLMSAGTLQDVVSMIPQFAALRGLMSGATGGDNSAAAEGAIEDLKKALANPKPTQLQAGTTINIGNMSELAAVVKAASGQHPQAEPPP